MSDALDKPRRTLAEARMDLLLERLRWLERQLRAEIAGNASEAAFCGGKIDGLTARLCMLDDEIRERGQ
jgi:hypothetical protein